MMKESGSVSVLTAATLLIALVLAMGCADVGRVLIARERAQTAADASALAAAQELAIPAGREPSEVAADYATRNGATLAACDCAAGGTEATVTVTVDAGSLLLFPGEHVARARAKAIVG
jgi:secretion/DNA translocation related TadE-like protein